MQDEVPGGSVWEVLDHPYGQGRIGDCGMRLEGGTVTRLVEVGSYVVGRVRRLRLRKTLFGVIWLGSSGGVVWLVCLAGVGGRLRLRKDGFRLFGSGGARPRNRNF